MDLYKDNNIITLGIESSIISRDILKYIKKVVYMIIDNLIETLINNVQFVEGLIVGVIIHIFIIHFQYTLTAKGVREKQGYKNIEWQRDEIEKLIKDVSDIRIPSIMELNEDAIENAYHLIVAYFERSKPLLYKKNDCVTIKSFFNLLNTRYDQMQNIKMKNEKVPELYNDKKVFVGEIKECKVRLLNVLQEKEKEIIAKMQYKN